MSIHISIRKYMYRMVRPAGLRGASETCEARLCDASMKERDAINALALRRRGRYRPLLWWMASHLCVPDATDTGSCRAPSNVSRQDVMPCARCCWRLVWKYPHTSLLLATTMVDTGVDGDIYTATRHSASSCKRQLYPKRATMASPFAP